MANNTISQLEINNVTYDILDANTKNAVTALQKSVVSSITRSGTTFTAKNSAGTQLFTFNQQDNNTTYSAATTSAQGLMSAADKTKLNGLSNTLWKVINVNGSQITSIAAGGLYSQDGLSISPGTGWTAAAVAGYNTNKRYCFMPSCFINVSTQQLAYSIYNVSAQTQTNFAPTFKILCFNRSASS